MTPPARPQFAVDRSPIAPSTMLVEASAGTGKTFSIAMSVIRLLFERDAQQTPLVDGVGNILVVTFTKAATDELIGRIRTLLRQADDVYAGRPTDAALSTQLLLNQLRDGRDVEWMRQRMTRALAEIDTLAVYTIHGFCKRILDEFALESGTAFGASLLEDDTELLTAAMQDWWRVRFYNDEAMASFAVSSKWAPETFLPAYRMWRRFPSVRLAPHLTLSEVRGQVDQAMAQLRAAYRERELRDYVGAMDWNKSAACAAGEPLDTVVRNVEAALTGDLGAAKAVGDALCLDALTAAATKKSTRQKQQVAALADWAVAQGATQLRHAMTCLEQAVRVDCFEYVLGATSTEKKRRNVLAFDDLLESLQRVLIAQGPHGLLARAIRRQFQAALIDEFQDTDSHQFDIFATAFHGCPLFLIGDPKQAIYAFRGADVHAYLDAARTADAQFTLATNYRSTESMVKAVNAVFQRRRFAFVEDAIGFEAATATPKGGPQARLDGTHSLHWLFVPPDQRNGKATLTGIGTARDLLFAACVRHIATQIGDGWKPRDIAVLVRSKFEGVMIAELLRAHAIPAVVSGLGNVMESAELQELLAVLEAIATPRHERSVRGALATQLWGGTARELQRLSEVGSDASWDALLSEFASLRELWLAHGFLQLVQEIVRRRDVTARFLSFDDGERRLTNLRHLIELVHGAVMSGSLNIDGALRWLRTARARGSDEPDVSELRLETDADAVQVYTIHKSKGLQFDIVYCPTLFSARPVDAKGPLLVHEDDAVVFDHHDPATPERAQQAEVERLAEDCRLAYVALTRARYRTYVGWGAVGSTQGSPRGAPYSALTYLLSDQSQLDSVAAIDRPALVSQHFKAGPDEYERVLQSLANESDGRMHIEIVDTVLVPTSSAARPTHETPAFAARVLPAEPPLHTRFDTYTISSFTHLAQGSHATAVEAPRDVDDVRVMVQSTRELPASDFRTFPAGRRAGTVLHTLFEYARFDDPVATLRARVAVELVKQQLAAAEDDPRIDATARMMRAVFETPMAPWPVTLANVSQERVRHEWQFLLPFASPDTAFVRQAIARCFEQYGGTDGERYAALLRGLSGTRVHGFLTGFVDCVFEHRGQWYVVDWKSNQLGADFAAYRRDALQHAMESHHYTLQYHLYLVALHRYLRVRLPGYDYDRHVGGAAYAFLRGFSGGATEQGLGWFTDRPSRALIEALSRVMDAKTTEAA